MLGFCRLLRAFGVLGFRIRDLAGLEFGVGSGLGVSPHDQLVVRGV